MSQILSKFWKNCSIVVLLVGICVVAYWLGTRSNYRELANGGLVTDIDKLNIGSVWQNKNLNWAIPLHNPTDKTIEITGFQSSCQCLSVKPAALRLRPQEQSKIELELDLAQFNDDVANQNFAVKIVPSIQNASPYQSGWTIRGHVKKAFSITPQKQYYDEIQLENDLDYRKTFTVKAGFDLQDIIATCRPPYFAVNVTKASQPKTFEVSVLPKDSIKPGLFDCDLTLQAITKKGKIDAFGYAKISGKVVDDIEVIPSSLLFGVQEIGNWVEAHVEVRSRKNTSFSIAGHKTDCEGLSLKRASSASSPIVQSGFVVRFQVKDLGSQSRELVLLVNRENPNSTAKHVIPVRYHGVRPSLKYRGNDE